MTVGGTPTAPPLARPTQMTAALMPRLGNLRRTGSPRSAFTCLYGVAAINAHWLRIELDGANPSPTLPAEIKESVSNSPADTTAARKKRLTNIFHIAGCAIFGVKSHKGNRLSPHASDNQGK
jgi:hypothetical protein